MSSPNNLARAKREEMAALRAARAARFANTRTEEEKAANSARIAKAKAEKDAEEKAAEERRQQALAAAKKKAMENAAKKAAAEEKERAEFRRLYAASAASAPHQESLPFPTFRSATRKLPETLEEYLEIIKRRELDQEEITHFTELLNKKEKNDKARLEQAQNELRGALNLTSYMRGELPPHDVFQTLTRLPERVKVRYDTKNFLKQSGIHRVHNIRNNNVRESVKRSFGSNSRLYKFERLSNNNLNTVKTRSKKYSTDESRLKIAFLGHGLSSPEDFVIVPEGYSVTFYTECGIPLALDQMLDSYYTNSSQYKHTYHEGSVFNNLKLYINPEMGSRMTEYVGVLPIKNGEIPRKDVPECPTREKILTDRQGYQYPSFYNINHKDPKDHVKYCSALDLYNYNIGSRLSSLTGRNTTLHSVRSRFSGDKMELDSFTRKIENSYPLLDLISKDRVPREELFRMFNLKQVGMTTRGSSPFNDFELHELLDKIKPGDYHFYMCRSYKDERFNNNGKKTQKRNLLSRQRSITKCPSGQIGPDPETSPIFTYFGGDDGKIAVLARFIENVLIPLVSDPGMIPFYSSLTEEYAEESGRPFSDYVNTFLQYTLKPNKSTPSLDDLMNPTNKIYSRFVNMRDGDAGGNRKFITFKNDVVLKISAREIEIINNLILLMYHLLVRINNNIFRLTSGRNSDDELMLAQTIMFSVLEISTLNPKLFARESMDKFFHKIKINSRYYNMLHVEISESNA